METSDAKLKEKDVYITWPNGLLATVKRFKQVLRMSDEVTLVSLTSLN